MQISQVRNPKVSEEARSSSLFGKLCFSAKDFAKPRFISVAVIKGQLVSNSVSGSYMLSEFCFYSSGLCHPISIWCQTPPLGLWRPPWSGSSCIDSRTRENLCFLLINCTLSFFCFVSFVSTLWQRLQVFKNTY